MFALLLVGALGARGPDTTPPPLRPYLRRWREGQDKVRRLTEELRKARLEVSEYYLDAREVNRKWLTVVELARRVKHLSGGPRSETADSTLRELRSSLDREARDLGVPPSEVLRRA
jgi:hypothetical protein